MTITLAIVGSRTFNDYSTFKTIIQSLQTKTGFNAIISGGAQGADKLAERYAKEFNVPITIELPDWNLHGKSAGFKRNYTIWDNANLGIAFWDGISQGTSHSFKIAKDQNKTCLCFNEQTNKLTTVNKKIVNCNLGLKKVSKVRITKVINNK